ncbi:uncharacterized protein LOC134234614 [Saccostrea cucullata]|uniref:uncharacterized protein LOC134234614 n=1 Tax=Saccostrea cuccullata TaxID=36930 RepID=UPI002ED56394
MSNDVDRISISSSSSDIKPSNLELSQLGPEPIVILSSSDSSPKSPISPVLETSSDFESDQGSLERPTKSPEIEFYEGNQSMPIFSSIDKKFGVKEAVSVIVNTKDHLVTKLPFSCKETKIFVVDTSKLEHLEDIRSHELGAMKNERVQRDYVSIADNEKVIKVLRKNPSVMRHGIYMLKRSYYSLKSDASFKRRIYELFDWKGNQHKVVILQFVFHGNTPPPKPRPHGNSKSGGIYVRTTKSTVEKVNKEMKPKDAFENAFESVGGLEAESMCKIPRNIKQIYNIKNSASGGDKGSKDKDDLFSIIQHCKSEQSRTNPFIRSIQAAPEPMCVCVTDRQLSEMEKFLTNPAETAVLGIDPTFNLGQFLVTVATYKHLQLRHRRTGNSPTMIGPVLIHQQKLPMSYSYLASTCTSLRPGLSEILFIGTDDEKAIFKGVKNFFPQSLNIKCFRHMRNNISRKLQGLGVSESTIGEYIRDIFGVKRDSEVEYGLVDATSEAEFDTELKNYEIIWNEREIEDRKTNDPLFYKWFLKEKADTFKEHLLLPLRISAGLGYAEYTTNANESVNKKLKEKKVDYKESQLGEFCTKLFSLVDSQNKDVEKAIIGVGPYELRPEYKQYEICQTDWFKLSSSTRQAHLKNFVKAPPKPSRHSVDSEGASTSGTSRSTRGISIGFEETGLSEHVFQKVWEKAVEILEKDSNIVNAPGDGTAMLVVSKSKKNPHFIETFKSGKIECPCDGYKAKQICSHAVAVAEKKGTLDKFLRWYKKCGELSISTISKEKMPQKPQKKPGHKDRSTKRKSTSQYEFEDALSTKRRSRYPVDSTVTASDDLENNYFLKFLKGTKVRVCYGCSKAIRVPPFVPAPPYDVVICRKEYRAYMQDGITKLTLTPQNVHYHLKKACLTTKNPEFTEDTLVICPPDVAMQLQDVHKTYLKCFNVKY